MKKRQLPIGISDFKTVIDEGCLYVDKTLLIEEIIENGVRVALVPRPRRFGKTLNLSMLRYFFEKSETDMSYLFEKLKVWKSRECRDLQGQFPVIFLTFKDVKHSSWESAFEHFSRILSREFQRHLYLLDSDLLSTKEKQDFQAIFQQEASQALCEESLQLLSRWLSLYHKQQVVLLIDEYDTPVHAAYLDSYYDMLIKFLRNFLSSCLKDNPHLRLGVLTGILRIAKESIFSGLNNVSTFTILSETFRDKFGLLESEVSELLQEYDLAERLPELKAWYNGYRIGSCTGIYNPWSVLNCIAQHGSLSPYWVNTSDNALVKRLIIQGTDDLKADLEELLKEGIIEKNIDDGLVFPQLGQTPNSIWSLLLYTGYLTLDAIPSYGSPACLKIPNLEVGELYRTMIVEWFTTTIHERHYHLLLNSLTQGDINTFSQLFKEFMLSSASVFDVPADASEKIYHAFVLGMLIGLKGRYDVKSNRESGLGRYDVMLFPKNPQGLGIIMEFKKVGRFENIDLETAVNSAMQQIHEKKYALELEERGVKRILYLAFAFEGKNVLIKHQFTVK
ncbi:MAG: AAA family ATPase [Verrucomicrobia bacterium]|nr:AAA family ATPase [Verrucomicrobiota bacterium]